jgi:hypothetical protein
LKTSPKEANAAIANALKNKFQRKPTKLPINRRSSFRFKVPFSWNPMDMKRTLKITSTRVDW